MKHFFSLKQFSFIAAFLILLPITTPAADQNKAQTVSSDAPVFNAPDTNAEIRRRDSKGSSRGLSRSMTRRKVRLTHGIISGKQGEPGKKKQVKAPFQMVPLASEATGLCSNPSPALLWYSSDPWPLKLEFRLNPFKADKPVLDTRIDGPSSEGIYRIDLADYNISLEPGVEYEWFLTIVFDEDDRSADYFISATIMYAKPSDDLSGVLAKTPGNRLCSVYAGSGYWYDAIDSLTQLIDAGQKDSAVFRKHRASLLEQVHLPEVAAYDMKQIPVK
ncbi:MAG: DUF928 domain-containing protein [Desulfobacterales bacterium]|nr:DUF928 domain-containing protein [Desulfobacterales bacterium]